MDRKTDKRSRNLPYAAVSLFGETGTRKFMEAAEFSSNEWHTWFAPVAGINNDLIQSACRKAL
jgi:hypothetical protein